MEPVPGSPGLFKAMGAVPVTDCGLIIGSPVINTSTLGSPGTNSSVVGSPGIGSPAMGAARSLPNVGMAGGVRPGERHGKGGEDDGESVESSGMRSFSRCREKKVVELKGEVDGVPMVSVM